jgi:hypothetical protein
MVVINGSVDSDLADHHFKPSTVVTMVSVTGMVTTL